MHNKLWLADNSVAIVGGRNLGDEYFDAEPNLNFTDIDMLSVGPVAEQLGGEDQVPGRGDRQELG